MNNFLALNSSWVPNESPQQLWNERSNLAAASMASTFYGVHFVVYVICMEALWQRRKKRIIGAWKWMTYVTTLFVLDTILNAMNQRFNELAFIDYRDIPGGPIQFIATQYSTPVQVTGFVVYFISQWLQDGLLLYRFSMFFERSIAAMIFPVVLYLASIAISIVLLYQISQPNANIWQQSSVDFAIPTWTISIALNIILTTSICIKLFLQYRRTKSVGISHGTVYLSILAMLVESAALYTGTLVVFLVLFGIGSFAQNIVLGIQGAMGSIAPTLIVLRVARGYGSPVQTSVTLEGDESKGMRVPLSEIRFVTPSSGRTAIHTLSSMDKDLEGNLKPEQSQMIG